MTMRILVAVDDSPAAMAAARAAIDLASRLGAPVRVLNVLTDGVLSEALQVASRHPRVGERRVVAAAAILRHVAALASAAGVQAQTCQREGTPARCILAEASAWAADLVVIGRSAQDRRAGGPYVGSQTAHVLELAEQPVLVVPAEG